MSCDDWELIDVDCCSSVQALQLVGRRAALSLTGGRCVSGWLYALDAETRAVSVLHVDDSQLSASLVPRVAIVSLRIEGFFFRCVF